MADDKVVRFVRCPKCENVLPELPDYSVYRCGGCNAVLRAKARNPELDSFSDKSDEERAAVVENFENFPDKGTVTKSDTAEKNVLSSSSSFRRDERSSETDEKRKNASTLTVNEWVFENDFDANAAGADLGISDLEKEVLELKSRVQNASVSQRSAAENGNTVGVELHKAPRADVEGMRFSTYNLNNMNEGSSNSRFRSVHGCENGDGLVINRDERRNQDKAVLLRKLNELKDQLTQSCGVSDKPKESVPQDPWFHDVSSGMDKPYSAVDKRVMDPPFINQYPDHYPILNRPEMSAAHGCFCPAMHTSNRCPVYEDPYGPHMLKPAPKALPYHYQQPSHLYFSRQYIDTELDPYAPYSRNGALHQSPCSCLHCYGKHQELPGQPTAAATFCNKRFPDVSNDSVFYNHENSAAFGLRRAYDPASVSMNPPSLLKSQNPPARWSNDVNVEMRGFAHLHPQTMVVANSRRRCHPMAGGAPFVTCPKCYELLQIPKKVLLMEQTLRKMQCGVCSAVIDFATVNKKIVVVAPKQAPSDVEACSNEAQKGTSQAGGRLNNRGSMNFYSDDSSYDLQSIDREPVSSSTVHDLQSINSSSLSTSEEECIDGLAGQKDITESTELPVKGTSPRLPPGSPLQQHFDYSSNNQRFGKGNRSTRSDQEVMASNKATSRQNSLKDLTMATEVDVSFCEYSNNGTSQGSADVSREDRSRTNKGSDSFFAGVIKKSFRDFSKSNHPADRAKTSVVVNGHPITDRMVKKAEKLAGPIHSGKYWYDSRAGFWGVMGGPCLGIIPPFIEEFNYPMPSNCASGNTNVFVNGRELHRKDLDLLASRGLPTDADRSYIIEISGRVLDEDSGEELDSLGKLAPTVEKVKHGFGMRLPRSAAA